MAATALCVLLAVHASGEPFAYWVGGYAPRHGVAIGISLSIDPLGAAMAAFAALLVTAALVYSLRYFDAVKGLFHGLMLLFMAGMVGFCLTGDLFNLVVFFELMSAVAYGADRVPDRGARADPGRDQLRDHQQHRRLRDVHRRGDAVRAHRRAEHGTDRGGAGRAPRRSAGDRRDGAVAARLPDQGGGSAAALLARGRARGCPDPGVRAVQRGDGRARGVRRGAAVLGGVRRSDGRPRGGAACRAGGDRVR